MSTMENSRRLPRPKQQPKEYLRCAQCGPGPATHKAFSDHGLMQHMGQKTRRTATAPGECWTAPPSCPGSLQGLWYYQIATVQPLRLLQQQHASPRASCWRCFSGQTTTRASECSARWCGRRPATSPGVIAGAQETNLRISDSSAAPGALPASPPSTMRSSGRPPRPKQQPREYLRCAQCGPDPAAHMASTDGGLVQHMKTRIPDSVGQPRWLDRATCAVCGTIRSQRYGRRSATPTELAASTSGRPS